MTRRSVVDVGRELAADWLERHGNQEEVTVNRHELEGLLGLAALKGYELATERTQELLAGLPTRRVV